MFNVVAARRREQILKAACEVIARKGFARASTREIARAARMPVATMYRYVRSKDDILYLIYERFLEEINDRLEHSLVAAQTPREKLLCLIRATVQTFDKYHEYVKLLFRETKSLSPKARANVFKLDLSCVSMWTQTLEECAATGDFEIREAELMANLVYYLCTAWPIRHWALTQYDAEAVCETICDLVLRGIERAKSRSRDSHARPQTQTATGIGSIEPLPDGGAG